MGLNLGPFPMYTRNVNLILNLQTGTSSPQFHVQCHDFCETVKEEKATRMTNSWCRLAGFTHTKEKKISLSLKGSTPSEYFKEIDKEAHAPTSNEDVMDQESLEKNLTEGDEIQPNLRPSNIISEWCKINSNNKRSYPTRPSMTISMRIISSYRIG